MGKINFSRVLLGGVVAGIVSDILGFLADGLLLAPRWADGMKALGKAPFESVSQIVWFQVLGLLSGIFANDGLVVLYIYQIYLVDMVDI